MGTVATTQSASPIDSARRKRLGQYFTGIRLARLLAYLADARKAKSIIDPMSGDGDMIEACFQAGAKPEIAVGIEIDPLVHRRVSSRFDNIPENKIHLVCGNSFSRKVLSSAPAMSYDLVITNPPYVRYQSLSRGTNGDVNVPDGITIRNDLFKTVELFPSLDEEDRRLFRLLIESYSGLSDLAVPSWLLCAMLTRVGGILAMVVPEAWLSRDYAQIIQYLLLRWFKIRYVIEDCNATWFKDALVKTTLVIAERIKRRDSAFSWNDEGFLLAQVLSEATDQSSIVGQLFSADPNPEVRFSELLRTQSAKRQGKPGDLLNLTWIPLKQKAEDLKRSASRTSWLSRLEGGLSSKQTDVSTNEDIVQPVIPPTLAAWLGTDCHTPFVSPAQLGIKIGQGLRTGANQFFYVDALRTVGNALIATPDRIIGLETVSLPSDCVLPVLRRQSELPKRFRLDATALKGRVLVLNRYVLPEDAGVLSSEEHNWQHRLQLMPDELAQFVRRGGQTNVGTSEEPKYIQNMSAVKTNARKINHNRPTSSPRFWYMLPEFTPRHRPALFVARVNYGHPKTYINAPERVLIDANFSTLWLDQGATISPFALLAILNSSWCMATMELTGTVMGGGALKLEAAHLRRLPIPKLTSAQWNAFEKLGSELSQGQEIAPVLAAIDQLVVRVMFGNGVPHDKREALDTIRQRELMKRTAPR